MKRQLLHTVLLLAVGFADNAIRALAADETINHEDLTYLKQGWTPDEREPFYFTSQGSQLVPYHWFLALEQPDSEKLFRDDAHLNGLRFIPWPKSDRNPDALPIGFVKDDNPKHVFDYKRAFLGEDLNVDDYPRTNTWLGFTCAACHTAVIEQGEQKILVDGAPAMADIQTFLTSLSKAVTATHEDDQKLARFAKQVLVPSDDGTPGENKEEVAALRNELKAYGGALARMVDRDKSPVKYGFARLDAFGAIFNEVCATSLEIPENARPADAPASFPFLWDIHDLEWVQWNGSADNPISRNVGEVLGVFGHFTLTAEDDADRFQSTVHVPNLFMLEKHVAKLRAPSWPEQLKAIDSDKAERGAALYAKTCIKCHTVRGEDGQFPMTRPNATGHSFIRVVMVPAAEIGTDPKLVTNFLAHTAKTGKLAPFLDEPFTDKAVAPRIALLAAAVKGVTKRQVAEIHPALTKEQLGELSGFRDAERPSPQHLKSYKARPLNGIWATAPYLHNGSVPNLYELLLPAAARSKTFYVGSRDFDSNRVGFATAQFDGGFEFRTVDHDGNPIPGNSNAGHEGKDCTQIPGDDGQLRDFTDEERWELVEYMKTLK